MNRLFLSTICMLSLLLLAPSALWANSIRIDWNSLKSPGATRAYLSEILKRIKENPNDIETRLLACEFSYYAWRGEKDVKFRLQLVANAHRIAQEATEIAPDNAGAWYWRGATLAMVGVTQGPLNSLQLVPEGKKATERSIELDPGYRDGTGLANMGRMYFTVPGFPVSIGDKAKAREILSAGIRDYPQSTYFPLYMADLAWSENQNEEALSYLAEVLKRKPRANDYTVYMTPVNHRKARELEKLIRAGKKRHPFNDVLSDHPFVGIVN